jgi:class 3 adenylate cyclase/tetratricopeptide (TPR) repeat protein
MPANINDWLRGLDLEQYSQTFRDNEITDELLPELTAEDLKDLGVSLVGHRRKLLAAIAALRNDPPVSRSSNAPTELAGEDEGVGVDTGAAERRQLTLMFCDLVGSTSLASRLDPEDLRELIGAYHGAVEDEMRRFGGFVAKYMGDGVLIYFGYPQAHEDDAERAVSAALALTERVSRLPAAAPLVTRIGIATGLVVVGDLIGAGESQERGVVGNAPNLAARLQGMAPPGGVLIAEGTRSLVGDLFEYRNLGAVDVRGFDGPVRVWQVLRTSAVESRFEAFHANALTPLVGREEELDLLLRRWTRAKAGEGQVVLLSGEPGIGKSRLTAALHERLATESHTRVRYYCTPHRGDSALHPVIAQLERAAGFEPDDPPAAKLEKVEALLRRSDEGSAETIALIADLLSLPYEERYPVLPPDPQRKREMTLIALLKQLEVLAAQRPALMIFEDAHWADSTSLELLDRAIERAVRLPGLLVVTFRPEFQAPWIGQANVTSISLNRLTQHDTASLVEGVTGGQALPAEILDRIIERTDGIPLFIEELTKSLLEGGLLRREAGHYVLAGPLPSFAIPASLQASLMARLDRLSPVREVAQIGAAIGREFSYELLAAVARRGDFDLFGALDQLVDAGLVSRRGAIPRASFVFKHALIQDAAYSSLLRNQRRELHARIGNALKDRFPEIADTQPEVVAHHLSEAGIVEGAIDYWQKAAERSLRRSAGIEAVRHLLRGIELTQSLPSSPERNRRALEQYLALGRMTRIVKGMAASETLQVFSKARDLLDDSATVEQQMIVLYGLWGVHYVRAEHGAARAVALECLNLAEGHARKEAPVLANYLMGDTLWAVGEFVEARHHLERSIELCAPVGPSAAAQSARDNHEITALSYLAWTLWPLGYPEQAAAAARQAAVLAHDSGHVPLTAFVSFVEVFLATALAAPDAPIAASADQAIAYSVEHGVTAYELWTRFCLGITLARRGDARQGVEVMRAAMDALAQIDAKILRPLHFGHLAAAHASLGETEIGLGLLDEALRVTDSTGERVFEAELHRLQGELLLDLGNKEDAEAALQTAVEIARGQQARLWELRAATSLARLKRDLGKGDEAKRELAPVYGWFTEGFDTADLKAAKALLGELV